jgi:hypothetical protein
LNDEFHCFIFLIWPYLFLGYFRRYTTNLAIWEGYSNTLTSNFYNDAVTKPVQAVYPNANINNYGSMTTDSKHCLPDQ